MKTFQEFLDEGRKKEIEKLAKKIGRKVEKSVRAQQKAGGPVVADYGNAHVGSKESEAAIMAMMKRDSDWRKSMRKRMEQNEDG